MNLLVAYETALTPYRHLYWDLPADPVPGSPESFKPAPEPDYDTLGRSGDDAEEEPDVRAPARAEEQETVHSE